MIRLCRLLVVMVALCAVAKPATSIVIPLQYKRNFDWSSQDSKFFLASVRLADHDLVSAGAAPAPIYIDFETSEAKGLWLADDEGTTVGEVGGRNCRVALYSSTFGLNLEDRLTSAVNASDVYVLLEYYDRSTTDGLLKVGYGMPAVSGSGLIPQSEETTITNTGVWKKHQFKLQRTAFGQRGRRQWDFGVFVMPKEYFSAYGYANLKALQKPPADDFKLPALVGEDPFYLEVKLGDKTRLAAVDRQSAGDTFYNRVRFDANDNRDLTDDAVITGTIQIFSSNSYRRANFPEIDTEVAVNGRRLPYRFQFDLYSFNQSGGVAAKMPFEYRVQCSMRCSGYYAGELELDGRKYKVALGDSDCNGRFDDRFGTVPGSRILQGGQELPYYRGDTMYLTREDALQYEDGQLLGDMLILGNKVMDVAVDPSGTKLKLEETGRALGLLKIPQPVTKLQLKTPGTSASAIMVADVGTEFPVPVGEYELYTYTMERKDQQGDLWRLSARAGSSTPATVVAAGTPGTMTFGEPFKPLIRAQLQGRSQERSEAKQWYEFWKSGEGTAKPGRRVQVSLEFGAEGVGGDFVSGISHVKGTNTAIELSKDNPQLPKEPSYKIVKEDGEIATQGSFAYG
jgi:hypothetical protein